MNKKEAFWTAIKPIKKAISIDEMIKEQNYKPIEKERFYKKVTTINIEESLEELLKKLTK